MIATDRQGTIQAFNAAAQKLLGYSPEEVIGRLSPVVFHDPIEILHESGLNIEEEVLFQPGVENLLAKARHGIVDEQEWTYICKNGVRVPVRVTISPITDEIGILIGFLFCGKDITQQKQAEAASHKAETHFRRMVGNVPGMIYQYVSRKDGTGYFPFVGYHCLSMFEVEPDAVQQNADVFWQMVYPEDLLTFHAGSKTAAQNFQAYETELRVKIPSGCFKWIQTIARPTPQPNGDVIWDGVMLDISDRKKLENERNHFFNELEVRVQERTAELEKAYQKLNFLIENFQLAVIEWDAEFRVQRWSPEAEKLFGWRVGDVAGKDPYDWKFIYEADQEIVGETIQALLNGSQSRGMCTNRNYTQDGTVVHCEWYHSALVDEAGKLVSVLSLVLDITERTRSEEELQASQRRFLTAFHRSPAPLAITTYPEGIQLDVNESWIESTGYSREEAIGRKSSELKFWQYLSEQAEFIKTLGEQGSVRNMLVHSRIKSGEIRKILLSSDLIELDGRLCLLNSAVDITEQKHAEELLKQQLAAIEASIDGIAILDQNERYTYLNQAHAELFGFDGVEQLLGKTWREIYDADEIVRFERDIFPIVTQKGYWRGEATARKQDGTILPQEVALTRLEDGGLTCICRDINERKAFEAELQRSHDELENRVQQRTEELRNTNTYLQEQIVWREALARELAQSENALRQSEARLQAFLDNAEAVISLTDTEGHYLLVNQKFQQMHKLSQADVFGQKNYEIFSPEQAGLIQAMDQQVLETASSIEYEQLIQQGDEFLTYLSIRFPLVDQDGNVYAIGCISTDITARKQAESKVMEALEKEKELSELKTRFITNTSHEFRTPLTTILGSAELLESSQKSLIDERKKKHCDRIKVAVKHMTQLLDDVLVISKADAGKLPFNPTAIDLETFCWNLVEELNSGIGSSCPIYFSSQGQALVGNFDEKLLRQILENLISNAVKYSPQESCVLLELKATDEVVTFHIKDNGIGIPQTDLQHLFQPFHRASNVGNVSGTGLGLAIVKKAVELHKGEINVDSVVGEGSLFTVRLPRYTTYVATSYQQ